MDMITLAMAKAYSDSKGGYVKPGEVIAFDGNTNGKEIFADTDMGLSLVKVSDKFYDLSKVNRIVATDPATGEKQDIPFSAFTENGESLAGGFAGETYVISTDGTGDNMGFLTPGTWVLEKGIYISRVEFAETIVPIDQKYLPGVCLPVVEIAEYAADIATEVNTKLTACIGTPIVLKVGSATGTVTVLLMHYQYADRHMFYATAGEGVIIISSEDGVTWTFGET